MEHVKNLTKLVNKHDLRDEINQLRELALNYHIGDVALDYVHELSGQIDTGFEWILSVQRCQLPEYILGGLDSVDSLDSLDCMHAI